MLEYQGEHGKAKVMIDAIDESTVSQIYEFLNHKVFTNPIAIMPDCHAGKGAVIGFTMEMTDKIIPNVVGVDIGCGMQSMNLGKNILAEDSREDIDRYIRAAIPFGTNVRRSGPEANFHDEFWKEVNQLGHRFTLQFNNRYNTRHEPVKYNMDWLKEKSAEIKMDFDRALKSVGTLGGGNHFIELGKSENTGDYWCTVHSGSRQFGLKIANYHQKKAGKGQLTYLEGNDMFNYLTDMLFAQAYAELNRFLMCGLINIVLDKNPEEEIETTHNFIDFNDFIIRKGAIRSYENEKMIIPFNMEDGILICEGKSNAEWNYSAPHGAGRVGSRKWAKQHLSNSDAKKRMEDKKIYCSALPTDELKGAYKDPKIIEDAIEPTATIVDRLIPVIAMKDKSRGRKRK